MAQELYIHAGKSEDEGLVRKRERVRPSVRRFGIFLRRNTKRICFPGSEQ
jgi:hypothetical protein